MPQREKIGVDVPTRTVHHLKTRVLYFQDIVNGFKNFEIRYNDRDYKVGDELILMEWDDQNTLEPGHYTGREVQRRIAYMTDFQQRPGYVVLGLER